MMKNIDKIRQMTVDELASKITTCKYCAFKKVNCVYKNCIEGHRQWLEQEVEDMLDEKEY